MRNYGEEVYAISRVPAGSSKSGAKPLRPLRAAARLYPPFWSVPHLFPRTGAAGEDSRRSQGVVV